MGRAGVILVRQAGRLRLKFLKSGCRPNFAAENDGFLGGDGFPHALKIPSFKFIFWLPGHLQVLKRSVCFRGINAQDKPKNLFFVGFLPK